MCNVKIDYMGNHFNFFYYIFLLTYQRDICVPAKFLTGGKLKFFGKVFIKYLIIHQILQTCEISKNYPKPLLRGSQRVKGYGGKALSLS